MMALLVVALASTGCIHVSRHVALKEFNSAISGEGNSPLRGHTVCVKGFVSAFDIHNPLPAVNVSEPPDFHYVPMTDAEKRLWHAEAMKQEKTTARESWPAVGVLRNGFGKVLGDVYALNDPGEWLTDALKADLQKLGARVVDESQEADADVTVGGTITYLKIDIYMKYWVDLVVDAQMKTPGKAVTTQAVHTHVDQVAWVGTSFEFYQALRECEQKFSRVMISDLEQKIKP